ncbi:MAG: CHAT domain-containing protein, partial [Gemmatimonadota bacterium]
AAVGAQPERLADLLFLAEADSLRAADWLRQAHTLADSLRSRRAQADVDLSGARLALREHDWPRAVRGVQAAATGHRTMEPMLRWQLAETEAAAYYGAGRLTEAETAARRAVDAVERVRSSLVASWSRAQFLASRAGTYATLAEILLARDRVAEAFTVADAARGRALLEHLAGLDAAETASGSLLASFATQERTLRRIDDLEQQLSGLDEDASPESAATRNRLRHQLARLQSDYVDATRIQPGSVRAAAILGVAHADIIELQGALRPGEAVAEYLLGPDRVHLFVVTRTAVRHLLLPTTTPELVSRVRVARDIAGRPGPLQEGLPVLGALYTQLLGPAMQAGWFAGIERLVIIPHGVLSYLPFAALRDPQRNRYLIQDLSVMVAPSAASLVALRRSGDAPVPAGTGVVALAPFPDQLPGTAAELDGIARTVPGTEELKGDAATEMAVRRSAGDGRVLHLATHGVLNPDNPLFSRMDLRASPGAAPGGDGRLEVHEVLGLHIGAPLVYLSGCETALGQMSTFTRGDDFVTLAQSFLFAGARGVVATLWRVPDAGSVPLVEAFYRNLRHDTPAEALAAAQRELAASPTHASPYYWAGYVLNGDGIGGN